MNIVHNYSLKSHNSFAVEATAALFSEISSIEELQEVVRWNQSAQHPILMLGGGSNLLFVKKYDGLVILNSIKGIELLQDKEDSVLLKVGAGEVWHDLVLWAVARNYAGIENLSLIPGRVGAAPVQNIGAYGVELCDVLDGLWAVHLKTGEQKYFDREACQFAYRDSIFKRSLRGEYSITSVILKLSKTPTFTTSYGALNTVLREMRVTDLSIQAISEAVIKIRNQKLPNPQLLGNAGSFFKNPVVSRRRYKQLCDDFPAMPSYPVSEQQVKIPAAWLIDQAGWKGFRRGDAGVHQRHALVLVNYGKASGRELKDLAFDILHSVNEKFKILLTPEVNIL